MLKTQQIYHFVHHFLYNLFWGVTFAVVLIPFHQTDTYQWLEDVAIDWMIQIFRATPPKDKKTPPFVLLDIDEATYQSWGEPLITPRDKLLQLIKTATENQAKIVMIDVDLNYLTDRSQPLDHPNNQADYELYQFFEKYQETCGQECPYIFLTRHSRRSLDPTQPRREQGQSFLDPVVIAERRIYWAATLFDVESDQVMRRWHLWQTTCNGDAGDILPSMQFLAKAVHENNFQQKLVELAEHKPDCRIRGDLARNHPEEARLNNRILYRIPWHLKEGEQLSTVDDGHLLLESVSVKTLLERSDKLTGNAFKGRIVIIGGSHEGSRDSYATPLGKMPGIWVLANATHSLLQHGEFESSEKWQKYLVEGFLIVFMSIVFACLSTPLGILASFTLLIIPASFWLFEDGVWLGFVIPSLGIAIHSAHAGYEELRKKVEELSHVH